MTPIRIYKQDEHGNEVLHYDGVVVSRTETEICVRAVFQYGTADMGYMTMERGDIFTEWFYTDRWYNIFRIENGKTGALRGWYCNITRPAVINAAEIRADDLALDVIITPDGTTHLLDEDEFEALAIPVEDRQAARDAVAHLYAQIAQRRPPFDEITSA